MLLVDERSSKWGWGYLKELYLVVISDAINCNKEHYLNPPDESQWLQINLVKIKDVLKSLSVIYGINVGHVKRYDK